MEDPSFWLDVLNQAFETEIELAVDPAWRELCAPLKAKAASLKALMGLIPDMIMMALTSSCNEVQNIDDSSSSSSGYGEYTGLLMALESSDTLLASARKATFVLLSNTLLGAQHPLSVMHKALVHLLLQCQPAGKAAHRYLERCCCDNKAQHLSNLR